MAVDSCNYEQSGTKAARSERKERGLSLMNAARALPLQHTRSLRTRKLEQSRSIQDPLSVTDEPRQSVYVSVSGSNEPVNDLDKP